ncbi:MAG: 2-C-methyl-D-erythritol 2,4-cyclodiphosphate synthase [Patescibacteria group bacterium]
MNISIDALRIGIGQDSHSFSRLKKPLVLGGIKLNNVGGFEANSDGDVILHALCNALSSAIGGNSIGTWSDDMLYKKKIKDSKKYVDVVLKSIHGNKYVISNLSISIEAKKPRFSLSQLNKIKFSLSKILKINVKQVGITISSGEGLSDFGKGKGMMVFCAVLLIKNG